MRATTVLLSFVILVALPVPGPRVIGVSGEPDGDTSDAPESPAPEEGLGDFAGRPSRRAG